MCNYLHKDYKPIPESGLGLKLFRVLKDKDGSNSFESPISSHSYYLKENQWIKWDDLIFSNTTLQRSSDIILDEKGFCFILNKNLIDIITEEWFGDFYLIEYRGGLGKFKESNFLQYYSIEMALCKEFKILKKYESKIEINIKEK